MASPTLPQLTVSTTDPLSSCIRTVDCSATADATLAGRLTLFTNAIAAARFGDLIVTEPGDVLDGNWALPLQTLGTAGLYTVIRPKTFDSAVAIGTRATSANTASMTTMRSVSVSGSTSDPVFQASTGAKYWWLSGLQIIPKASTAAGNLVNFAPTSGSEDPSNQPSYMMLDRVYIHGDTSGSNGGPGALRGVLLNGTYTGVINSTIDEIKKSDADAQAISMANGAGPVHIENNLLGATGENVLFETGTGETISVTVAANGTDVTGTFLYDAAGKSFNVVGSNTVTVASRTSGSAIVLGSAITGVSLPYTGTGYLQYNHAASFFPGDITIKRNHFRKKNAWNVMDPTFERTTGNDVRGDLAVAINLTIDGSNNLKATEGGIAFDSGSVGLQMFITGGTGFTTGPAYIVSVTSGVATFNRALGTVGSTGGTARLKYSVKNALELKSGSRVFVEGNVFDGSWCGGQNYIITLTPRYTNSPAGDLTFQYNVVKNAYAAIDLPASEGQAGGQTPPPWLENDRITFRHNLFDNIQTTTDDTSLYWSYQATSNMIALKPYLSTGTINGVAGGSKTIHDFTFEHNTIVGASTKAAGAVFVMGDGNDPTGITKADRFILRNNIIKNGTTNGPFTSANGGLGTIGLDKYTLNSTADARTVTKNIFFDTALAGADYTHSVDTGNTWVTTANQSTIGFTNYAGGDYTITGANATAATDGTMIGADIATLNTKTAGAITGVWPASPFRYLPIRWP